MSRPPAPERFAGAVLCGGASQRMGREKATLVHDGVPMAVRVARALGAAGASPVALVGGREGVRRLGWEFVSDEWPGEGPLGGVVVALDWAAAQGADRCVVLSCDLLDPDPDVVRHLLEIAAAAGADAAVPVVEDRRQWTHAVWRVSARRVLRSLFDAGERSLVGASAALQVHFVDDVTAAATADADSPEDLERGG